ncbi:hypothetical protein Tco_0331185 [Tanacetum coccineum]
MPNKLWERIKLPRSYEKALEIIEIWYITSLGAYFKYRCDCDRSRTVVAPLERLKILLQMIGAVLNSFGISGQAPMSDISATQSNMQPIPGSLYSIFEFMDRVERALSHNGGEFAYTPEGMLKDKFLDACISNYREPQNQNLFYCQDCCPLEKAKNVHNPEPEEAMKKVQMKVEEKYMWATVCPFAVSGGRDVDIIFDILYLCLLHTANGSKAYSVAVVVVATTDKLPGRENENIKLQTHSYCCIDYAQAFFLRDIICHAGHDGVTSRIDDFYDFFPYNPEGQGLEDNGVVKRV